MELDEIDLSHLFAEALDYISYVGAKGMFNIYQLRSDDPIVQSGWFEKFTDETGGLDVESDYYEAILYARSVDDLPPKLKAFCDCSKRGIWGLNLMLPMPREIT